MWRRRNSPNFNLGRILTVLARHRAPDRCLARRPDGASTNSTFSVLSALFIHYYFDHFLFLRIDGIITPLQGVMNQHAATVEAGSQENALPRQRREFQTGATVVTFVID